MPSFSWKMTLNEMKQAVATKAHRKHNLALLNSNR